MVGINSYGGYIPRFRLNRKVILDEMGWINPAVTAQGTGEKAIANFDEDTITMAVAAGIDCLNAIDRSRPQGVYFASTSMPYKERLNAGIIKEALALKDNTRAADFGGALKAGTTALLAALEGVESKRINNILVASSECRLGKPGSLQEMIFGDAAAALLVGDQEVIAEFKGSYSTTYDFVDHYRGGFAKYDRQWEDRWIRDIGYELLVPEVVNGLLEKYQLKISDFSKIIYSCHYEAERKRLNKKLNILPKMDQNNLLLEIGDVGAAQPLIMLVNALEDANPGEKIMIISFGNGCDALFFEVTENIRNKRGNQGISGYLAGKKYLDKYGKYLIWREIMPGELGLRSEVDQWPRWSLNWRKRKTILGLWGSKCKKCGTVQYPPQSICVNPDCKDESDMEDFLFSDKRGRIISYTGDNLAASYNPPAIYGSVEFDIGGRCMFDFTDCDLEALSVGMPVAMSFRKKYYDQKRDVVNYFWKAIPMKGGN